MLHLAYVDPSRYPVEEHPDGTVRHAAFDSDADDDGWCDLEALLTAQVGVSSPARCRGASLISRGARPVAHHLARAVDASVIVVGTRAPGSAARIKEFVEGSVGAPDPSPAPPGADGAPQRSSTGRSADAVGAVSPGRGRGCCACRAGRRRRRRRDRVRAALENAVPAAPGSWPWTTFGINLRRFVRAGCAAGGGAADRPGRGVARQVRLGCGTGVLGGFTTYSTFVSRSSVCSTGGRPRDRSSAYALVSLVPLWATTAPSDSPSTPSPGIEVQCRWST